MKHGNSKSAETFNGPTQNEKFLKHVLPSKARQAGRISRFGIAEWFKTIVFLLRRERICQKNHLMISVIKLLAKLYISFIEL